MGESEIKTMQHRGSGTNLILNLLESGDILALMVARQVEAKDYEAPVEGAIKTLSPILIAARDSTKKNTPYFGKDSISLILGKL
jgi:hypothetical protein